VLRHSDVPGPDKRHDAFECARHYERLPAELAQRKPARQDSWLAAARTVGHAELRRALRLDFLPRNARARGCCLCSSFTRPRWSSRPLDRWSTDSHPLAPPLALRCGVTSSVPTQPYRRGGRTGMV
jgi:hypothetical protein